jgi:hypothetical protein
MVRVPIASPADTDSRPLPDTVAASVVIGPPSRARDSNATADAISAVIVVSGLVALYIFIWTMSRLLKGS